MKIKRVFLLIFLFVSFKGFSQKVYLSPSLGFHSPILKQTVNDFRDYSTSDDEIVKEKLLPLGFANGFNFSLSFGVKPFENFAFELGFSQVLGKPYEVTVSHNINTVTKVTERSLKANSSYFSLGFVITSNYELINPYMRFDILYGTCNFTLDEKITHPSSVIERTWKYDTKPEIGFKYNIGATVALSKKYEAFSEIGFQNITFSPNHAYISESIENNTDNMEDYTTFEKEINYIDEIENNSLTFTNEDEPEERLKENYSFSSFSFKIGIRINIINYD